MTDTYSIVHLRCIEADCMTSYTATERLYTCKRCGGLLDVAYDFHLPASIDKMKARFRERRMLDADIERSGVWRFRELLPFVTDASHIVTLNEGNTPLYDAPRSAHYAGLERLQSGEEQSTEKLAS